MQRPYDEKTQRYLDELKKRPNDIQGVYEAAARYALDWSPPTTGEVEQARAQEIEAQRDCYAHARRYRYVTPYKTIDEERYQNWRIAYDGIPKVWRVARNTPIKMEYKQDEPALPGMKLTGATRTLRKGEFERREVLQYWKEIGHTIPGETEPYDQNKSGGVLKGFSKEWVEEDQRRLQGKFRNEDGSTYNVKDVIDVAMRVNRFEREPTVKKVDELAAEVRNSLEVMRQAMDEFNSLDILENLDMPSADEFDLVGEFKIEPELPEDVLSAQREAAKILEKEVLGRNIPDGLSPEELQAWLKESFELLMPPGYRKFMSKYTDPHLEAAKADERAGAHLTGLHAPNLDVNDLDMSIPEDFQRMADQVIAETDELMEKCGLVPVPQDAVPEETGEENTDSPSKKSNVGRTGATAGLSSSVCSEKHRTAGQASSGTRLCQRYCRVAATALRLSQPYLPSRKKFLYVKRARCRDPPRC